MIIYHVELNVPDPRHWKDMTSEDDCIRHHAIVDLGYYLQREDATKVASQYPTSEVTISHILVIESL